MIKEKPFNNNVEGQNSRTKDCFKHLNEFIFRRYSFPFPPNSHSAVDQEKPCPRIHPCWYVGFLAKGQGCKAGFEVSKIVNLSEPQFLIHEMEIIIELVSGGGCIDGSK